MVDTDVESVRVTVRIRPLTSAEIGKGLSAGWQYNNNTVREQTISGLKSRHFDRVLGPNSTNAEAYQVIAADLVSKAVEGFNATVFAYGQTGSGKTWTMMGDTDEQTPGIIPQALHAMFQQISQKRDMDCLIRCSFLELYNECINDLLNTEGSGQNLAILADDPVKGAIVGGLREEIISSVAQGMDLIRVGNENRKVASTAMNARSSRSHTIFRLILESRKTDVCLNEEQGTHIHARRGSEYSGFDLTGHNAGSNTVVSYLNLVDLAGSERQSNTKASGSCLKEGAAINRSLLALAAVISKLSNSTIGTRSKNESMKYHDGKHAKIARSEKLRKNARFGRNMRARNHVPYRNSKLTRILKQSLGGNSLTSIVVAISPASSQREESRSSLKFGHMCKSITNTVSRNAVAPEKTLLKQYKMQIANLKMQLRKSKLDEELSVSKSDPETPSERMTRENSALREKISFLQAMFLGAKKTRNTPVNTRMTKVRRGRAMSIAVHQDNLSDFKMQILLGNDERAENCRTLARSAHRSQDLDGEKRNEKLELPLVEPSTKQQLSAAREELAREKGKSFDLNARLVDAQKRLASFEIAMSTAESLRIRVTETLKQRDAEQQRACVYAERLRVMETDNAKHMADLNQSLAQASERAGEAEDVIKHLQNRILELDSQLKASKAAMSSWQVNILGLSQQQQRVAPATLGEMLAGIQKREAELISGAQVLRARQSQLERAKQHHRLQSKALRIWEMDLTQREDALARRMVNLGASESDISSLEHAYHVLQHSVNQANLEAIALWREYSSQESALAAREASLAEDEMHWIGRNVAIRKREFAVGISHNSLRTMFLKSKSAVSIQNFVRDILRCRIASKLAWVTQAKSLMDEHKNSCDVQQGAVSDTNEISHFVGSDQSAVNLRERRILDSREQAVWCLENRISGVISKLPQQGPRVWSVYKNNHKRAHSVTFTPRTKFRVKGASLTTVCTTRRLLPALRETLSRKQQYLSTRFLTAQLCKRATKYSENNMKESARSVKRRHHKQINVQQQQLVVFRSSRILSKYGSNGWMLPLVLGFENGQGPPSGPSIEWKALIVLLERTRGLISDIISESV